jgi:hypothetical protein
MEALMKSYKLFCILISFFLGSSSDRLGIYILRENPAKVSFLGGASDGPLLITAIKRSEEFSE